MVFEGWLVPIGELDHAESLAREIIDLTDDSKDDVLNVRVKPANSLVSLEV